MFDSGEAIGDLGGNGWLEFNRRNGNGHEPNLLQTDRGEIHTLNTVALTPGATDDVGRPRQQTWNNRVVDDPGAEDVVLMDAIGNLTVPRVPQLSGWCR